ncbi:hypothetical protein C8J56DRAFT_479293 [Mycena floridula]|nr:hypothetical protein C8J56DRAFT_479293 [Mycena floridula]
MHINIPELLASSSPPSEAERAHVNQLLDISNDEICRLTATIDKLVLERELLQRNVASYEAILAPIRLLSDDVLREIFVSCLPPNKAAATATADAPLLLGLICRYWRQLSLSTPALWASIQVQFSPSLASVDVQRLCDEAKAWLARSGTCPLTIQLSDINCKHPDSAINFVRSLTRFSNRWRSIEIDAPATWLTSLVSLSKSEVPKLEKFSHLSGDVGCGDLWQSLGILESERLNELGLCNSILNINMSLSNINFGQLTRLNLDVGYQSTPTYISRILTRCRNLVACHIRINIVHPATLSYEWTFEPVTLHRLLNLSLSTTGYSDRTSNLLDELEEFLSRIKLPQLSSFKHTIPRVTSWLSVAQRSPIENLTLFLAHLGDESVVQYLRSSISIKRLRINFAYDSRNAPESIARMTLLMTTEDAGKVICPCLEVLELPRFIFPSTTFVDLVKRRAAFRGSDGNTPLKVVHATFVRITVDLKVLSQLDDLVASGLALSVVYCPRRITQNIVQCWPQNASRMMELDWPT